MKKELLREALVNARKYYSDGAGMKGVSASLMDSRVAEIDAALAELDKAEAVPVVLTVSSIERSEAEWHEALRILFKAHGAEIEKNPEMRAFVDAVKKYAMLHTRSVTIDKIMDEVNAAWNDEPPVKTMPFKMGKDLRARLQKLVNP